MLRIVAEDDIAIRPAGYVLDPSFPSYQDDPFAKLVQHVVPDLGPWIERMRKELPAAYPARYALVRDRRELREALPEAEALVVERLEVGPEELSLAPRLRLVLKFGTDLANIDEAACRSRGVALRCLRRRQNVAVAEHAFALMLALAKKLNAVNGLVTPSRLAEAGKSWGRITGLLTLQGATLGLIGFGEIGREVARRAKAFDMVILYTQRHPAPAQIESELGASYVPLETLLAASDWISIHTPLNPATQHMLHAGNLSLLKPGALLINTARARLVEPAALHASLREGRLGGAAFDVLYAEPAVEDDPLLGFDNVILTPHLAGASRWNLFTDLEGILQGIEMAFRRSPAANVNLSA
jgi:phosphoglycerate dehydrogenase-like enzyme